MNTPSKTEFRMLLEHRQAPCLSLFLPTHRTGVEAQQDPLRLKRMIREAEHLVMRMGSPSAHLHASQREEVLAPIRALLEDDSFWLHASDGLAIFLSPDVFVSYRLPSSFREQVVVSDHFSLKPLLPFVTENGRFYILALSQNEIRLLEGTRYHITEVELPETVPESLAQALKYDDPDNQVRYYSSSSGASIGKGGRRAVIFYGQGIGIDESKDNLLRYFQQIDRGLRALLHDAHVPMVLAGVEYLFPIYQEANTYLHLLEQGVPGNPETMKAETLHERSWSVVEPYVLKEKHEAMARYQDYAGTARASNRINEILPAAYYGRVESVLVALDREEWGTFDPSSTMVQVHQEAEVGDEDLLDLASTQTLLHGGLAYAVEQATIPGGGLAAAVFRY